MSEPMVHTPQPNLPMAKLAPSATSQVADELERKGPGIRADMLALIGSPAFTNLCREARRFWSHNVKSDTRKLIFVDLLTQDIRVSIRTLTIANAIRRVEGATLVGILHPDPEWERVVWDYYDADALITLARAYGVEEFLDLRDLGRRVLQGETRIDVAGHEVEIGAAELIDDDYLVSESHSAAMRILRLPRIDDSVATGPAYRGIIERAHAYARIHSAVLQQLPALALIVSHVDYSTWGFAVHAAMKAGVPVIHAQSTGGLKAYAWFPEHQTRGSFRAQLTQQIGEYFKDHVWPRRDVLRRSAELVTHRARADLGRPSWWRTSGQVAIKTQRERRDARVVTCQRLGINADRPVVAVFAHAMTDAIGSNVEAFENFVEWLEETASFARTRDEVTWLFLDHPSQHYYDVSDFFGGLSSRYAQERHMLFMPSLRLAKHELWSVVDQVVTVRGSVSNEYPAFGVPALQAGWSEWSHCGFSTVTGSPADYVAELGNVVTALVAGRHLPSAEVVERARLWGWFYRAQADVVSGLVPHWNVGNNERCLNAIGDAMRESEISGDPAFVAVARMWKGKAPILTRFDMAREDLESELGEVAEQVPEQPWGGFPLNTFFDRPAEPLSGHVSVTSGESTAFALVSGVYPGVAVVGRCDSWASQFGIRYDSQGCTVRVEVRMKVDDRSQEWLLRKRPGAVVPRRRSVELRCQGALKEVVTFTGNERVAVVIDIPGDEFPGAGLLTLQLTGEGLEDEAESWANLVGLQVDQIEVFPVSDEPRSRATVTRATVKRL